MTQFLLDNSVFIVAILCFSFVAFSEYRGYLRRSGKTSKEVRSSVLTKLGHLKTELLIKLTISALITVVISMVSFREVWMNDCFHIVFLTNLLYPRLMVMMKYISESEA